jgi:very-short-patch-repair endonuclease
MLYGDERVLWQRLRARQLGGYKFRRQCTCGGYIVDLLCVERRVIVEVDGGQHADRQAYDRKRTDDLEAMGMIVLRYWNDDVLLRTDAVLNDILATLTAPHPDPPPGHGERERMARARALRGRSDRP